MSTARYTTLIEPAELAQLIGAADAAVIDCRHELARPDQGALWYAASHVPGALFAHLDRELSGPVTAASGRHPLPDPERFAGTLSRWGVDRTVQVIAYDQGNGAVASRLWWMLRWMGHPGVAVLNGGFAAWLEADLPLSSATQERQPRHFSSRPSGGGAPVATDELQRHLAQADITLVDARAADRFAGRNETLDPVAGHIPGARNHPFTLNLDAQGRFLSAAELARRWRATLANAPAASVVSMCGSGVTACHNLLALELAGMPGARLYAGSWSEWIRDPARPVARA
ncbi:MAG TPA: sulfurtransferase [Steroidobacteraceae bacterium]|nr:sulfurtransferase [Steroidobacteraceae bacterium]